MREAIVALKPIPEGKILHIQEPVRDLAQLQDNLANTASPLFLMHNSLTETFNQAEGKTSPFIINGFEAPSGAQPEVNAQKAVPTLLSIERQGAYLPRQTPSGEKFILAFLARALSAFTREARERGDRKEQFKLVAERASRNGQIAKISVFDALNRPEWVREDYEIIYELRAEALPIVIEGVVPVSDDKKLTKEQFRARVRGLLELDNEIRQHYGWQTSAMHSLALKNTDGRLRGDDASFSEGNAGDYGAIQWEEMDAALSRNGTGPKEARLHTHNIGMADATAQSYINRYLEAATNNQLSICVDGLAGGYGFPNIEKVGNGLRTNYGWDIQFSPSEKAILKRKRTFLGKGIEPFEKMLDYVPSHAEEQLFECAPAALRSGMRLGIKKHIQGLNHDIVSGKLPRREGESIGVAQKRMERGLIRTWGMLNAASKRILDNTYSITPVANHHNLVAGDLTGQALDIARQAYLDTEHGEMLPITIAKSEWDARALQSFSVVEQTPAAGYLTRADADIELSPEVLKHLCRIRTAAVLPEDQALGFLGASNDAGGRNIGDRYPALRAALLDNVMDKVICRALLEEAEVEPHLIRRYVEKYAGMDESLPGAGVKSVMLNYSTHIDKLLDSNRLWDGWVKADLDGELRFAAITLGAKGFASNLKKLEVLATAPGHAHDNISWWEGVTPKNEHELAIAQIMKANGVNSFEKLFETNLTAAQDAGRYYVAHMQDCRVDFGFTELIMHRPRPPDNNQLWGDVWQSSGGKPTTKLPPRPAQPRDILAELEAGYLRGAGVILAPKQPWPGLTERPWFSPQRFAERRFAVA